MSDGQTAVVLALEHHPLGPQMHSKVRPIVVALDKGVPDRLALLLPRLMLGHEPPKWGEIDDNAVVKVGVPQRRDALHLGGKSTELVDEGFLGVDGLALLARRVGPGLLAQRVQLALFVSTLGAT